MTGQPTSNSVSALHSSCYSARFNDGLRIAITDFGLATTDKYSDEFRTGSIYHMSPGLYLIFLQCLT